VSAHIFWQPVVLVYCIIACLGPALAQDTVQGLLAQRNAERNLQLSDEPNDGYSINITGNITLDTAAKVENALRTVDGTERITVLLTDSEGGDIDSALRIGRMIRLVKASVVISGRCYSSCGLIFLGGVQRKSFGVLGLHRPFFFSKGDSPPLTDNEIHALYDEVRAYFREMNIADSSFENMMKTPPESMLAYEKGEFREIAPAKDPVYDEWFVNVAARNRGITTIEYRARRENFNNESGEYCRVPNGVDERCIRDAYNAATWGMDLDTYRLANELAQINCEPDEPTDASIASSFNRRINKALDEMTGDPLSDYFEDVRVSQMFRCRLAVFHDWQ